MWTSPAALGLFTVALACISSIALNDQVFNFARYLSVPVPALILVGLALLALGNAVEAIGIWGWAGTAPGGTWQPTKAWSRPTSSVASAVR